MKRLIRSFVLFFVIISAILGAIYFTAPLWVRPLIFHLINKNFGDKIYVEDVRYVFPDKVSISKLEIANFASFSNVNVSIGNAIRLSPITLELVKPKLIVIHNEKGEWSFPPIPGIQSSGQGSNNINIEIKAKIKDGIVVVRDLKLSKDIEIKNVNGDLTWKSQIISYTVSTSIDKQFIKSYGNYDFSKEKGDLTFEFKNTLAEVWAPIFLPDIFSIEKGFFTGWINTKGEKTTWKVKGEIEAYNTEGKFTFLKSRFTNVATKVKIEDEVINILEGKGNLLNAEIKFSGKVMPIPYFYVTFKNLNLELLDKEILEGRVKLSGLANGQIFVSDSWEKALIDGSIEAEKGSIYDFMFNKIQIMSKSKLPLIKLDLSGDLDLGNIKGNISFNLENNTGNFELKAEDVKVEKIAKLFNLPEMEGKGDVLIKGKKEKEWVLSVNGVIENGRLGDYSAERILFGFENEDINIDLNILNNKSFFFQRS